MTNTSIFRPLNLVRALCACAFSISALTSAQQANAQAANVAPAVPQSAPTPMPPPAPAPQSAHAPMAPSTYGIKPKPAAYEEPHGTHAHFLFDAAIGGYRGTTGGELSLGGIILGPQFYASATIGAYIHPEENTPYESQLRPAGLITYEYCLDTRSGFYVDTDLCAPITDGFGTVEAGVRATPRLSFGVGARISNEETNAYGALFYRFANSRAGITARAGQDYGQLGLRFPF